jgi:DNA (cytosine-5)-methyltransferase 1
VDTCDSLVIAFTSKDYGGDATDDLSPTPRSMGHTDSHMNGGGQVAIAIQAGAHPPAVAFDMRGRDGGAQLEGPHDTANIRASLGGSSRSYVAETWAVRRLMPLECERLQGFPDGWTAIPWRKKPAGDCPDGPRYKAIGNSMAVNVMRWIGERIAAVDAA